MSKIEKQTNDGLSWKKDALVRLGTSQWLLTGMKKNVYQFSLLLSKKFTFGAYFLFYTQKLKKIQFVPNEWA